METSDGQAITREMLAATHALGDAAINLLEENLPAAREAVKSAILALMEIEAQIVAAMRLINA